MGKCLFEVSWNVPIPWMPGQSFSLSQLAPLGASYAEPLPRGIGCLLDVSRGDVVIPTSLHPPQRQDAFQGTLWLAKQPNHPSLTLQCVDFPQDCGAVFVSVLESESWIRTKRSLLCTYVEKNNSQLDIRLQQRDISSPLCNHKSGPGWTCWCTWTLIYVVSLPNWFSYEGRQAASRGGIIWLMRFFEVEVLFGCLKDIKK